MKNFFNSFIGRLDAVMGKKGGRNNNRTVTTTQIGTQKLIRIKKKCRASKRCVTKSDGLTYM